MVFTCLILFSHEFTSILDPLTNFFLSVDLFYLVAVSSCLDVMMRCIDNNSSIELIGRYYSVLNESIVHPSCQWKIFMDTSLMLMGFPEMLRKTIMKVIYYSFYLSTFSCAIFLICLFICLLFVYLLSLFLSNSHNHS